MDEMIKFWDVIYLKDEMSETWIKYKLFQRVVWGRNQEVMGFISEFDPQYNLSKAALYVYSDTILVFWLLEASSLSENDKKLILIAIGFEKVNFFDQMKASLKKFKGRALV